MWSQDDFWHWPRYNRHLKRIQWGYNIFTKLVGYVRAYAWPRRIRCDAWLVEERGWKADSQSRVHSWRVLASNMATAFMQYWCMKWVTEKAWRVDAVKSCPNCGNTEEWSID
jgi:hypothetical protein